MIIGEITSKKVLDTHGYHLPTAYTLGCEQDFNRMAQELKTKGKNSGEIAAHVKLCKEAAPLTLDNTFFHISAEEKVITEETFSDKRRGKRKQAPAETEKEIPHVSKKISSSNSHLQRIFGVFGEKAAQAVPFHPLVEENQREKEIVTFEI